MQPPPRPHYKQSTMHFLLCLLDSIEFVMLGCTKNNQYSNCHSYARIQCLHNKIISMVRSISQKRYVILSGKAREDGDVNQSSLVRIFFIYYACLFDYQTTN